MEEASVVRDSSVIKTNVKKHVDECPISNVVVYRDRAEVTRQISLSAIEIGELQFSILCLTQQANPDSIRVKTIESNCDILEVSHEFVHGQSSLPSTSTAVDEIKARVDELEEKLAKIDNSLTRLNSQRAFLSTYTNNFVSNSGAQVATRVDIKAATDVLVYYQNEVEKIDDERILIEKEKKTVSTELEIQRRKLIELTNDYNIRGSEMHITLSVSLEAKAVGDIRLQFSYVVHNATWAPSYDIRVNNTDNTLALSYFAEVTQTTGENWKDCHLMLSTSNPSIGSTPPALPQKTFDFYRPPPVYYGGYAKKEARRSVMAARGADFEDRASFSLLECDDAGGGMAFTQQSQMPSDFRKAGVVGSGDAGSTVFTINRNVSIDCDNKPHKVMITARSFRPQMVHYAVPSVSPHVYIQAKTKNTSQYPLLASDNVSIYLDGNFISKSSLKQTSAGESFQIFVGVDPAVKVEYLPVRKEEYRKGWVSGSEVKKFSHATILHNTKSSAVRIILAESLPRSANEKITIELMEPAANTLTEGKGALTETTAQDAIANLTNYSENEDPNDESLPRDFVTKNKLTNNVVWLKTIQPQEKTKVDFVYKVTWPKGTQIDEY